MAVRTTPERVRKIVEVDDEDDLAPFIETANSIVDAVCVDSDTYTYTAVKLEMIERWLSAHFFMVYVGQVTVEQVASLRQQYAFKIDLYLNNTKYGQIALALDTEGNLVKYQEDLKNGGKRRVGMTALGRYVGNVAEVGVV